MCVCVCVCVRACVCVHDLTQLKLLLTSVKGVTIHAAKSFNKTKSHNLQILIKLLVFTKVLWYI